MLLYVTHVTWITLYIVTSFSYYFSASYNLYLRSIFSNSRTAVELYLIVFYSYFRIFVKYLHKFVTVYNKCAFLLINVTYLPDMCYYTRRVVEITSGI